MQDSLSTDFTGVPIVKVKVVNQSSGEQIVLDPFEFVKGHTVLNDEVAFIKVRRETFRVGWQFVGRRMTSGEVTVGNREV